MAAAGQSSLHGCWTAAVVPRVVPHGHWSAGAVLQALSHGRWSAVAVLQPLKAGGLPQRTAAAANTVDAEWTKAYVDGKKPHWLRADLLLSPGDSDTFKPVAGPRGNRESAGSGSEGGGGGHRPPATGT